MAAVSASTSAGAARQAVKRDIIASGDQLTDASSAFVDGHEDRMTVTAAFRNGERRERIHFHFEKTGGRWRLDDVSSGGADPWTLSVLLKYGRTGGD